MPGYYEMRDDLWQSIPGIEFLEGDERRQASDLFTGILADVEHEGIRPQQSVYWDDFMDLFGFAEDGDAWDWDDFREWYDSL